MKTYENEGHAESMCRTLNSERGSFVVIVDGPEDGQWTVLRIEDAIEAGFLYRWVA